MLFDTWLVIITVCHAQAERAAGATPQDLKASGSQPGDSSNGHTDFLAGGWREP